MSFSSTTCQDDNSAAMTQLQDVALVGQWSLSERLHKTNFLVTAPGEMLCYTAWGNSVTRGIVESDLYIKVYVTALPWQIPKEE